MADGMLRSVEEIIEALGGNDATAKLCGLKRPAVSMWKQRGTIPPDYWHVIAEALRGLRKKANPAIFFKT